MAPPTRHKIILGIDYGTTFSGVSYVTTDKSDIDDINIIVRWPGGAATSYKTPTRIAYYRENREELKNNKKNRWGFNVVAKLNSYSWTKLLLDKNAYAGEYDDPSLPNMSSQGIMALPSHRDAQGVCEDFLREVYTHVSTILKAKITAATFDITPMECWITIPAIWSEEAKSATREAARKAGFGNRPGDEIFTIGEPEAAAIATLKTYSCDGVLNPIKPGEHILICDCGGGTVDITTYTITRVEPSLEFDELCVGVGGKCGSTYIDRNLHSFLSTRFGAAFDDLPVASKCPNSAFMRSFEGVKQDFGISGTEDDVELNELRLNLRQEHPSYDEEERTLKLTHGEMKTLFDPVVNEVKKLVSQQVQNAKKLHKAEIDVGIPPIRIFNANLLKRIILVGGFGDSPYLHKVLEKWCSQNGKIMFMCPDNPQAAVVRGAALRGLEGVVPRLKRARRHYGISLGMEFETGIDPETRSYVDEWDCTKRCRGRVDWMITKGQQISSLTKINHPLRLSYTPGTITHSCIELYSTALDQPPRYDDDSRVELVGRIRSTFPAGFGFGSASHSRYNEELHKTVHQIHFQVLIEFGKKGENLTLQNVVNGKVLDTAVFDFTRG